MDLNYFQKINNTYMSKSKQETELYLINRNTEYDFNDSIDYQKVKKNGIEYELIIIKDTEGNTFKKKIKSRPSAPFNLGDYIEWNNQIWLVTLLDPDDKTHGSGYMYLCTILLRWQNEYGQIVERFGYSEDFTKYSTGKTGNDKVQVGDYQYGITLPCDIETKKLKRGKRFAIDFEDIYPPDVYALTNRKIFLNDYNYFKRGAVIGWTLSYDFFNPNFDKFVQLDNGTTVCICDYTPIDDQEEIINHDQIISTISPLNSSLIAGATYKQYIGTFLQGNQIIDLPGEWEIDCLEYLTPFIIYNIDNNKINIKVRNDSSVIGGVINLTYKNTEQNISTTCEIIIESII